MPSESPQPDESSASNAGLDLPDAVKSRSSRLKTAESADVDDGPSKVSLTPRPRQTNPPPKSARRPASAAADPSTGLPSSIDNRSSRTVLEQSGSMSVGFAVAAVLNLLREARGILEPVSPESFLELAPAFR
jgi:hypothetical protein